MSFSKKQKIDKRYDRSRATKQPNRKASHFTLKAIILCGGLLGGGYYYMAQNVAQNNIVPKNLGENNIVSDDTIQNNTEDISSQSKDQKSSSNRRPSSEVESYESESDYLNPNREIMDPVGSGRDIQSVAEDLNPQSVENDIYESPEDIVHRRLLLRNLKDNYLENKNEREKKAFVKQFVQIAKEQGYKVHFLKNGKVILEPIDEETSSSNPLENIEEIKVRW